VIPKVASGGRAGTGPVGQMRRPLPVPALSSVSAAVVDTVYALSAVDKSGRLSDRGIVGTLGWAPGTRLHIREQAGVIVVCPAADGVHCISERAFLTLPLTVRRWWRLTPGDKVLLAADRGTGVLVIHPMAVLHTLLADVHASALRGDAA
jgi:hypothetical protein